MAYRYLSGHLHAIADGIKQFFRDERGLGNFKTEEEVDRELDYRPTLHTHTKDHHILCIDVQESPYSAALDSIVLDCVKRSLPIELYVAFPGDPSPQDYKKKVDRARTNGVGVIEVRANGTQVIHEALALSLLGLREVDPSRFPARFRAELARAESTFRAGSPVEGCLIVYKELEALSRKIVDKTRAKGLWKPLRPGEKSPRIKQNTAWQRVTEILMEHLDHQKCPALTIPLLGRILSVAPHRNDTGHKVTSLPKLIRRDTELKTRFESATDLLWELIQASKTV
jgi:hypothetical protein